MATSPTITLRVPQETNDALTNVAEATGRPVGELVRDGIDLLLSKYDSDTLLKMIHEARKARDAAMTAAIKEAKQRSTSL